MERISRVQLIKDDSLFTNSVEGFLDLVKDTDLLLNISIGDIRDISKRTGSFSKTIKLSGSKNNNLLLNNYFNVNIKTLDFDINKKQRCAIIENGIVVIDNAYLRLISVDKIQSQSNIDDERVEYSVEIRDSIGDFFNEINNKELSDFNFSEYNHLFNADEVVNSFSNTEGYKYVLPWIDDNKYRLRECLPGIFAKDYWDRIHNEAGYTYEWSSLDDDNVRFDKLIIPFNGDVKKIEDDVLDLVSTRFGATGTPQIINANTNSYSNQTVSNITKPWSINNIEKIYSTYIDENYLGSYNFTSDTWISPFGVVAPGAIVYEIDIEWEYEIVNTTGGDVYIQNGTGLLDLDFERRPTIGICNTSNYNSPIDKVTLTPNWLSSGTTFNQNGLIVRKLVDNLPIANGTTKIASGVNTVQLNIAPVNVNSQWEIYQSTWNNLLSWYNARVGVVERFIIKEIKVRIVPSSNDFGFNFPVNMNNFVPKKIKQSDYIKSIYQMYNLYVEIDKKNSNKLIYKTRDEFYDGGEIKDWTLKMNKDKKQIISFVPEISSKRTIMTYKQDDKDIYLKTYYEETEEIYGQVEIVFDNENVRGTDTKTLLFSPTINQNTWFNSNNPVWDASSPKNNIRVLLDNGMENSGVYYIENYPGNSVMMTEYPFLSMIDKVENPQFDIAFGINDFYSYDIKNYTSNNLYTNFWRRTFSQINNGKMLTAYFDLTEEDIFKFKLDNKIYINDALWYVNKIIDYNSNKRVPTKIELLSVEDDLRLPRFGGKIFPVIPGIVSPNIETVIGLVGPDPFVVGPLKEVVKRRNELSSVQKSGTDVVNLGKNNVITSDFKGVIIGDDKNYTESGFYVEGTNLTEGGLIIEGPSSKTIIDDSSVQVGGMIYNESGIIYKDLYVDEGYVDEGYIDNILGSVVFNYDEATYTTSYDISADIINLNGDINLNGSILTPPITVTVSTVISNESILLVDASVAVNITLPVGVAGKKLIIKDKSGDCSVNNITIIGTIDGSSDFIMNRDYMALQLICDEDGNWWII